MAVMLYAGIALFFALRGKIGMAMMLAFFPASGRFITSQFLGSYAYTVRWVLFFSCFLIIFIALVHLKLSGQRLRPLKVFWRPIALIAWCWVVVLTAVDPAMSLLVAGSLSVGWMLMFIMIPQFINHADIRKQIVFSYILSILPLLLTVFAELFYHPTVLFSASKPGWDYCNPCTIAQNIAPVVIFSIALMFCATNRTTKLVWTLLAVVTSVMLLAIKARAPLLALTIALIVFFLFTKHAPIRRALRLAAIGLLLVAGAVILAFPDDSARWATSDVLKIRTASGKPRSFVEFTSTRSITMMSGLREWSKHPILGTGLGAKVRHPIHQYKWDIRLGTSSYLIILNETGAVGLVLLVVLLIAGTAGAYRTLREPLNLQDNILALASFSIIVGFLIHALIDDALSSFGSSVGVLVFCLLGLGANSQAFVHMEKESTGVSSGKQVILPKRP